jgi:hypothetical protein
VELSVKLGEHLVARPAVARLHATGFIIIAGMDDARVTLRRALGYIVCSV